MSALASWLGILAIPVLALVICNLIDYATGLVASKYRNETINSYKSFRGIFKKICMWLLIIVGALLDMLLTNTGFNIGIVLPFDFLISVIVAVWLICNEIISILENVVDIGVELPPFLAPLVKNIKKQVEDKASLEMVKPSVEVVKPDE
ncbi:MAG TPA: phage holin family protein [Mobilitalea sp.]|nr:phage holin family protein [Mobilitalea sp.]